MHEPALGPSFSGSVVLELGPGIGALLLHTPPELDGAEIEISLVDDSAHGHDHADDHDQPHDHDDDQDQDQDHGHQHGHRTHSQVRPRQTANGTRYAAVYPGLAAGKYTVWRDASTKALDVVIESSQVTIAWWPGE
jgi:hypothetical protein